VDRTGETTVGHKQPLAGRSEWRAEPEAQIQNKAGALQLVGLACISTRDPWIDKMNRGRLQRSSGLLNDREAGPLRPFAEQEVIRRILRLRACPHRGASHGFITKRRGSAVVCNPGVGGVRGCPSPLGTTPPGPLSARLRGKTHCRAFT
jgi:hypothetical protein